MSIKALTSSIRDPRAGGGAWQPVNEWNPLRPGGSLYASIFASVIIKLSGCCILSLDNDLEHLIWNTETRIVYTFSVRGFGVSLDFSDSL